MRGKKRGRQLGDQCIPLEDKREDFSRKMKISVVSIVTYVRKTGSENVLKYDK